MKRLLILTISLFIGYSIYAQKRLQSDIKWQIEPIKLTSLMVNTHPEYNGWGFEVGRKLNDKLWITSMIEKTKGGDFLKNWDPSHEFLVSFSYFAWLNTFRYYLKPEAVYTYFIDAGFELQTASHKFLSNNELFQEKAFALGPILTFGGEWRFRESMYLKWRMGGFVNLHRSGSFTEKIDDGQDQPSFYLYPHLSEAVINTANYAGDVAIGFKL